MEFDPWVIDGAESARHPKAESKAPHSLLNFSGNQFAQPVLNKTLVALLARNQEAIAELLTVRVIHDNVRLLFAPCARHRDIWGVQ
jgi:hypothetical protein